MTAQVHQMSFIDPEPGVSLAIVLASCMTGAGSPTEGLYVYDRATSPTEAHLFQTLVDPSLDRLANSFSLSGSTITMREAGYSSWQNVPHCCPDLDLTVHWTWVNHAYVGSPATTTALNPLVVTATTTSSSVKVGDDVTYTITIANTGPTPVSNVQALALPTYVPCTTPGCTSEPALVWHRGSPSCVPDPSPGVGTVCNLGTLAQGALARVSMTMQVQKYLNPLTFTPLVYAVLSPGGAGSSGRLERLASVTITVRA